MENHLPGKVSFALSQDNSISVRYGVACNLTTPMKILEQLIEDENPYVGSRARITIATISEAPKTQTNVVNFNFRDSFKSQNALQKLKKLAAFYESSPRNERTVSTNFSGAVV